MIQTKDQSVVDDSSITRMPPFRKSIQVTVELDSIFGKLLGLLPEDFKHREVLAHAIVGATAETGGLAYVYNALNGFTNDIDFEVNDIVICNEKERGEKYDANIYNEQGETSHDSSMIEHLTHQPDYKPNWKFRNVTIGECKVVEINLYAKDKLKVRFQSQDRYMGQPGDKEVWVNHNECSRVSNYPVAVAYANH